MTQAFNLSQLANGANTSGQLNASGYLYNQVPVANGGTALSSAGATGNMLIASSASAYSTVKMPTFSFRNRIINGDMRIDQRNNGASVTATVTAAQTYALDRWAYQASQASKFSIQQNAGAVALPAGFTNYMGVTSLAATSVGAGDYFLLNQIVEGFNIADLNWGTASAQAVTLSFLVRSSLTGTFSACLMNGGSNRSYPFTYSIPAANTWTTITVTVPGDTTGTWSTTNASGVRVVFSLGLGSNFNATANAWTGTSNVFGATGATSVVGTSGATFYITGVQLEAGSVATAFDVRDYGRELMMCQRYYWANTSCIIDGYVRVSLDTSRFTQVFFPVPMRAAPSITQTWDGGSSPAVGGVTTYSYRASVVQGDTTTARVITSVTASAEL